MNYTSEFKGLQFADYEGDSSSFISGRNLKSNSGPVACASEFGWILSGNIKKVSVSQSHCFESHLLHSSVHSKNEENSVQEELRWLPTISLSLDNYYLSKTSECVF